MIKFKVSAVLWSCKPLSRVDCKTVASQMVVFPNT